MNGLQFHVRLLYIIMMMLSQEISQNLGLESSLWLEKEKDKKAKNLNMKCKVCIKFDGEINSMSTIKKTWIDRFSGGRLVSTKDHYNSKPCMKFVWLFIASVLKTILKNLTSHILLLKMIYHSGSSQNCRSTYKRRKYEFRERYWIF